MYTFFFGTLCIYVPNIGALKYIKQRLAELKGKINSSTVIVGYFNTPLSTMDESSRVNEETADLNNTIYQIDLTDINRTFCPTTAQYTFFSNIYRIFSRIDHMLAH